jgi:quinoprotein glucose dehydrogenase
MNTPHTTGRPWLLLSLTIILLTTSCRQDEKPTDTRIKAYPDEKVQQMARAIEQVVTPELAPGLTLKIWAVDSLVADPVSIDIDDQGNLYYTRTNRQKNSEFDIRSHQDWEISSIKLKNIEEKRAFLRAVLAPEHSDKNTWLTDVNGDGSRDWRDLTVEKEHVYRLSDTSGDGLADQSQLVIEDFHDEVTDAAGGVLKHGDDLFIGIGPDLWRANDTNGDGLINRKESISHGYGVHVGFSGHGMSGIEVGPEGKIYWQIGDIGFSGNDSDGKSWDHANSGVIVRANPDGSDFEVFAYGNRNTHEFVFDEYGNLISEDNDGDHPGESERIVYVVNGADIGWRINWQFGKYRDPDNNTYKVWMAERLYVPRFEGQAAYITPPIANYVNGPTGMLYNPGTALGDEWKNTFFIAEFVGNPARSGIHAFKLNPKGATFELGESKKVLGGVLATGIDFGPDGAMYVADWIDGWDTKDFGRIWKLDVSSPSAERKEVERLIRDNFSTYNTGELARHLRNADMRVRQKAQFELAKRKGEGLNVFRETINQKDHQLARVHAIWGISQFAREDIAHAGLLVPLLQDSDPEIRAQAARWIGDVRYKDAGRALLPLLRDGYARARFFAAEALGRIAYADAVTPIVELLESNNDEDAYIRHAASLALARIGNAEALGSLANHPSFAVRLGAVVALRRMGHKNISAFLNDQHEYVVTEAARAINDDHSIESAFGALGGILNTTKFNNEPLIRRAINANFRLGNEEGLQNLISYASGNNNPVPMRAEAIAAISTWAKPSVLDRVDGRYRGEIQRNPETVRSLAGDAMIRLAMASSAEVRLAAVTGIGKLSLSGASAILVAIARQDNDPGVRAQALKSLDAMQSPRTGEAVQTALKDNEKSVRATALNLLSRTNLPPDVMVTLLENVINTRTVEERQQALTTMGTLKPEHAAPALQRLLSKLEKKQLPVEVTIELEEAIAATGSAELAGRLKQINRASGPDSVMTSFAGAMLGGDRNKGARLFYSHQTAQCIRCHAIGDYGGNAGPPLNGIASKLTREQLLEALVMPSVRLAPGYGTVSVDLKDGRKLGGILLNDDAQSVRLKIGDKPDTVLMKNNIDKIAYAQSSMPAMNHLLTKKEIRDVVSFLATLKE